MLEIHPFRKQLKSVSQDPCSFHSICNILMPMASHGTMEVPFPQVLTRVLIRLCLSCWCSPHQQIHALTLKHVSEQADLAGTHSQCAASPEVRAQGWREHKLCSSALAFGRWSTQLSTQPTCAEKQLPALLCSSAGEAQLTAAAQQHRQVCHSQVWLSPAPKGLGRMARESVAIETTDWARFLSLHVNFPELPDIN